MFLIKNDSRVLWGPKVWDKSEIQNFIYKNYNIDFPVPWSNPTNKVYTITDGVLLLPVIQKDLPEYNKRTQQLVGELYSYDDNFAYEYFDVEDKSLQQVKSDFEEFVTASRYTRENAGTAVTIDGVDYFIPTERQSRATFFNGSAGFWKLSHATYNEEVQLWQQENRVWVDLTEENISDITQAIKDHVNSEFQKEKVLLDYLDTLENIEDVVSIELNVGAMYILYQSLI